MVYIEIEFWWFVGVQRIQLPQILGLHNYI